jgi:hypothetical protein
MTRPTADGGPSGESVTSILDEAIAMLDSTQDVNRRQVMAAAGIAWLASRSNPYVLTAALASIPIEHLELALERLERAARQAAC